MGDAMPLTPQDVSNKRFTPVRLREGYDMGEVDQFLDEVESELKRLTEENDDLRAKLTSAGAGDVPAGDATPTPQGESGSAPVSIEKAAGGDASPDATDVEAAAPEGPAPVVVAASSAAETIRVETVPQASRAAARLLEIATVNADTLFEEAKADADKIIGEARAASEQMTTESRQKADQAETDARQRAQMLDQETTERRDQLFGDLEKERDKLNADVETLRSFEREYRSRLRSYFTQQLEALDGAAETEAPVTDDAQPPRRLRSILGDDDG